MSKIDDLIAKLCPNGVEYKKLGEVCIILDHLRKPISKENRKKGNIPYYGANGIQDYVFDYIFEGEYLLFGEDGSVINKDNSPILNWAEGKIWVNNHAHVLSENIEIAVLRYVYFYLQTIDVSDIVRGTPPKINQTNLRNIPIPVPPLEIQREIVNVLDTFTKLEAELEAELEARRRQYHYYRDQLLNFEGRDDVQWMTLGEVIANLRTGLNPRQNFVLNPPDAKNYYITVRELGGLRIVLSDKTDKINDDALKIINNRSKLRTGDVLFSGTGTIGNTALIECAPSNWNIKEGVYALTPNIKK
jgi:type I restriction enzyme S subunit